MADAPDNLDALRNDLGRAIKLIEDRTPGYRDGRDYFTGAKTEIAGSRVAKKIVDQSEAAPVNFAHIPVEVLADKIELASITATEPAAADALERWIDANDLTEEAADWILKALYFGDYYAIADPEEIDESGAAAIETVKTVGASPLSTIVVYDRKAQRTPDYGLHYWDAGSKTIPRTKAILYYDDFSVKLIAHGNGTDPSTYTLDYDGDDPAEAFVEHEGDRMLISHLAIGGKPYGVPVHRRAWGFQDAITKISANNLVDVDAKGMPSRWALMDPLAEIDDELDSDFGTDGPGTTSSDNVKTATRSSRTRVIPGTIAMLRGVKQTGTYDTGDSDGFLKNLDWYVRGMAVACGVALFEFDMSGEQPSGESRRRAEGRSNRKAAKIKKQAEAFFRDVADTALAAAGLAGQVAVTFNPSETSTDKDGLELVSAKVKAGVPLRKALLEAGYTDELVNEWYPEGEVHFSPELLSMIAEALGKLGTAKTLGVLTDDVLALMLPELFEAVLAEGPIAAPALPGVVTDPATRMRATA